MQRFKRIAGRHVSQKVEIHFTNQQELGMSLEKMRRQHPLARTLEELIVRKRRDFTAHQYDCGVGGIVLIGVGHIVSRVPAAVLTTISTAIRLALAWEEDEDLRGWATISRGELPLGMHGLCT